MKRKFSAFTTVLLLTVLFLCTQSRSIAKPAADLTAYTQGQNSLNIMAQEFLLKNPEVTYLGKPEWGGMDYRDESGRPIPGYVNPASIRGAGAYGTMFPPTSPASMGWPTESKVVEGMYTSQIGGLGGFSGSENSDLKAFAQQLQAGDIMAKTVQYPLNVANQAKAQEMAQATAAANAMGEIAKAQSASAIEYVSKFMTNFTSVSGNKWNTIRDSIFIPIAVLLLLPGAILTQVKAMMTAGNPVLGDSNPFEGILRSVVAIFLIPGSILVINYGIDFSNAITNGIAQQYEITFGRSMYKDALCAEIKAFPVRSPKENQNAGTAASWMQGEIASQKDFETNFLSNKIEDPCSSINQVPKDKTDEAMPSGAVAARFLSFTSNAGLTATWNILCAFQMAYLFYLFFVGPVVAALWVWPIKQFREAFSNWVEGVCTLCFWSLFWNTTILLMACFKGTDETGTIIMSALNFLASSSVKYAFDFAGLIKAAGQEAGKHATDKSAAGSFAKSKGSASPGIRVASMNARLLKPHSGNHSRPHDSHKAEDQKNLPHSTENKINASGFSNFGIGLSNSEHLTSLPPLASLNRLFPKDLHSDGHQGLSLVPGVDENGNPVDHIVANNNLVVASLSADDNQIHTTAFATSVGDVVFDNGRLSLWMPDSNSANGYQIFNSTNLDSASLATDTAVAYSVQENPTLDLPGGVQLSWFSEDGANCLSITNPADNSIELFSVSANSAGDTLNYAAGGDTATFSAEGDTATYTGDNVNYAAGDVAEDSTVNYTAYDLEGNLQQTSSISGGTVTSTFFDGQGNSIPTGFSVTSYDTEGNSVSKFYNALSALVATSEHVLTGDGSYRDTVYDSLGAILSIQQRSPNSDGGYALYTAGYTNETLSSSSVSNYTAEGIGQNSRLEKFSESGALESSQETTYDSNGRFVSSDCITYVDGAPGSMSSYSVNADGGICESIQNLNADGSVSSFQTLNYDSTGILMDNLPAKNESANNQHFMYRSDGNQFVDTAYSANNAVYETSSNSDVYATSNTSDVYATSSNSDVYATSSNSDVYATSSNSDVYATSTSSDVYATSTSSDVYATSDSYESGSYTIVNSGVGGNTVLDNSGTILANNSGTNASSKLIIDCNNNSNDNSSRSNISGNNRLGSPSPAIVSAQINSRPNSNTRVSVSASGSTSSERLKTTVSSDVSALLNKLQISSSEGDTCPDKKDDTTGDELYKPGTQSLERQMIESGQSVNSIEENTEINCEKSDSDDPVILAYVNFNLIRQKLASGHSYQAKQLLNATLENLRQCEPTDRFFALIESYRRLFQSRNMFQEEQRIAELLMRADLQKAALQNDYDNFGTNVRYNANSVARQAQN